MRKLFIISLFVLFFASVSILLPNNTSAQQVFASEEKIQEMKDDIDLWLGQQDIEGYILWQYSGPPEKYFENDAYSFFKGSPVCAALKEKSAQYPDKKIGVNVHNLKNKDAAVIRDTFTYLKDECGVSLIRIFGVWEERGGTSKLKSILDAVPDGVQLIVALTNFPGGSLDIMPLEIQKDPVAWYSSGYTSKYLPYAETIAKGVGGHQALYALELANEPHCAGNQQCPPAYKRWVDNVTLKLKGANSNVKLSIGQAAAENTTLGDSPSNNNYGFSNSTGLLDYSTAHHYGVDQNRNNLEAKKQTSKKFYIGEAGFEFGEKPSGSSDTESKRPLDDFKPGQIACNETVDDEFHPYRPYPGNACDPLIPKSYPPATADNATNDRYITYACASPIIPVVEESFDPYGNDPGCTTDASGRVTCYRTETIDVTVDLKDANLGVLGNTQDGSLTDDQKINNYLSYYLMGIPQTADHEAVATDEDIDRLINYSGPIRKLLPWDLQNSQARSTVVNAEETDKDVHDYKVGSQGAFGFLDTRLSAINNPPDGNDEQYRNNSDQYQNDLRRWRYGGGNIIANLAQGVRSLFNIQTQSANVFQNIPLGSVEDIAGEFVLSIFGPGDKQDPNVVARNNSEEPKIQIVSSSAASGQPGINPGTTPQIPGETTLSCDQTLKILPVGDSITAGVHSGPSTSPGGYRGPLKTKLSAAGISIDYVGGSPEIHSAIVNGDNEHEGWGAFTIKRLLDGGTGHSQYGGTHAEISTAVRNTNPDVVLIHAGTNDTDNPDNLENLEEMVNRIQDTNSNIVIYVAQIIQLPMYYSGNMSIDSPWSRYNSDIADTFSNRKNVVVVNMTHIPAGSDLVHPNVSGFESMAEAWKAAIQATCK